MKKALLRTAFLTITSLFLLTTGSFSQCEVTALAYPQVVCAGDAVTLSASGGCGFLMNNDFNNGTIGVGWSSAAANPVFNNPCGAGPNGAHLWVGTTPSQSRTLTTVTYDVSIGGCDIEWWMRYGIVPGPGNCEDPDYQDEGIHLQWSTNNGASWTDFPGPDLEPVGNTSATTPPFNTTTPGSGGYWQPHSSLSQQQQSELYYWNTYECAIPVSATTANTRFRWAQLSTSSTGYDAWGIDEVEIKCPTGNLNVIWSHGPTVLNPPAVTLPSIGNTSYDTCFKVTVSDTINSASDSVCVTVNPIPTSDFTISDTSICSGDSTTFTYTGSGSAFGNYAWDFDGATASGQGPHIRSFTGAGQKTISLSVQENGCKSPTTVKTVNVHPYPSVSFFPDPLQTCIGDSINFINQTSPSANTTWDWSFGDGNNSTTESPSHLYSSPGTYQVDLTATTQHGCTKSLNDIPISIYPKPVAGIDTSWINFGANTLQFDDVSQPGSSTSSIANWLWDFGGGTPGTATTSSEVVTYPGQGKYTAHLVVTNNHGCKDSTSIDITIYKLKIPNIITPNADGKNDYFRITAIEDGVLDNVTVLIYNRWGKKVYETTDYENDWDADNLADGTYYYVLTFNSPRGEEKFHGSITVLRK